MIELSAKLTTGTVYLAGEALECCITFCHTTQPEHRDSQSHSDALESLAWASAQIHCVYSTLGHAAHSERPAGHEPSTALEVNAADNGQVVFNTKPKILFCDLTLPLGESKTFWYRESLPIEAAPSYRGAAVKFSYKVTIATQQVGAHIRLLRIPLRVLPTAPLLLPAPPPPPPYPDTTDQLPPTNPFSEQRKVDTPLTVALQVLQNVTARRSPNSYLISNARGKVGRFCLFKHAYKLGEDIVGTFDFSLGTVSCMQVSVSLKPVETVKSSPNAQAEGGSIKRRGGAGSGAAARAHCVVAGLARAQLVLPVPLHVTPAFDTPQVSLKWQLHFEFVTTTERLAPTTPEGQWTAPAAVPVETMVWSLPVALYCTPPKHIAQVSPRTPHSLLIK